MTDDDDDDLMYGVGGDESYPLVRRKLQAPYIGFSVGSGDADAGEVRHIRQTLVDALKDEGLETPGVRMTSWDVGRSASAAEILAYVVVVASGIKQIDDAIPVLRKWWRALRAVQAKLGRVSFTSEALKLACIDDLVERHGPENVPRYDLMTTMASVGQFGDGTWRRLGPTYVVVPDPKNRRTHLYVVRSDGEILHRADLPAFVDDEELKFLMGPATTAGAEQEAEELVPTKRDWDRKRGGAPWGEDLEDDSVDRQCEPDAG